MHTVFGHGTDYFRVGCGISCQVAMQLCGFLDFVNCFHFIMLHCVRANALSFAGINDIFFTTDVMIYHHRLVQEPLLLRWSLSCWYISRIGFKILCAPTTHSVWWEIVYVCSSSVCVKLDLPKKLILECMVNKRNANHVLLLSAFAFLLNHLKA
jgi:hypothetical protein